MCTLQEFVASAAVAGTGQYGSRSAVANLHGYLSNFNLCETPDALRSVEYGLNSIQLSGSVRSELDALIEALRMPRLKRISRFRASK